MLYNQRISRFTGRFQCIPKRLIDDHIFTSMIALYFLISFLTMVVIETIMKEKRRKGMGKHPKLENLNSLFASNKDFSLTDEQYEKKTGIPLPKKIDYILKRSALAKKCKQFGYSMTVQEKIVFFRKDKKQ